MPSERREITFCQSELCQAVEAYLAQRSTIKVNGELRNVLLERAPAVKAVAEFTACEKKETLKVGLDATELGAALTLYCISHHIPLPRKSERAVQVVADNISLLITIKAPKEEMQGLAEVGNAMESSEEPAVLAANS